jgi:hypothetical protein
MAPCGSSCPAMSRTVAPGAIATPSGNATRLVIPSANSAKPTGSTALTTTPGPPEKVTSRSTRRTDFGTPIGSRTMIGGVTGNTGKGVEAIGV